MNSNSKQDSDAPQRTAGGYPYMPLNLCLKLSDAVRELGGARAEVQKSVLASHLGDVEKSGTFSQRITASKCFGLIDGHRSYSLTEVAKLYYFPTSESSKAAALLQIFSSPPAFKELLRRFDGGKLPSKEILGNILHKDLEVPDSWKDRVASFFSNSAQFVGVIDSQGCLRFNAAVANSKGTSSSPEIQYLSDSSPISPSSSERQPSPNINDAERDIVRLSHANHFIDLSVPADLSLPLWEKLERAVRILKPQAKEPGQ